MSRASGDHATARFGAAGYVAYLIPGYVATIVLFTGGGIAVAVAEDKAQGLTDRLLSLPIARSALVTGRTLADFTTNGWSIIFTAALGFAFGFRLPSSAADGLAALGLCLLYGLVLPSCSSSSACSPRTRRRPWACP